MQIAALLIVILAAVMGWVWVFQERMVFFPLRELDGRPSDVGLAYEDVHIVTRDGVGLHGWYVPGEDARGTVLFCHGNAGNISHRLETVALLHGLGLNVLLFDYRGYGKSGGRPREAGLYRDAEAAWDYLTTKRGEAPERIVLMGRSLGGGVAAWLAARRGPAALILESTFTSIADLGRRFYPLLPRFLARIRFDTLSHLAGVRCPLLVAHSRDDDVVPFVMGQRLYEAHDGLKCFLPMRGDHSRGWLDTGASYVEGLDGFLRRTVGL